MNFDELLFNRYFDDWSKFSKDDILSLIKVKSKEILTYDSLKEKIYSNKKLHLKYGIDPTAKDIHIGHLAPIMLLNIFVKTGHTVHFVIGDFTAQVGDPSGRNSERKPLTNEEIKQNLATYTQQVAKYVDISALDIRKNSEWLNKVGASELFGIFQNINLAQAMQRDDFRIRLERGGLSLAEVCYAVLMGLDSVALKTDIEIGGQDQLLNFMQCKDIMKMYGMESETAIVVPILEGLAGDGRKMSKSYNNYVAVNAAADDKFGKIMSLPDNLLLQYYTSFAYLFEREIEKLKEFIQTQPLEAKKQLATYLVAIEEKSLEKGKEQRQNFERLFSKNELTEEDFIDINAAAGETLIDAIFRSGQFASKGEIRRLIKQNAIKNVITNEIKTEQSIITTNEKIKAGKRQYFNILI